MIDLSKIPMLAERQALLEKLIPRAAIQAEWDAARALLSSRHDAAYQECRDKIIAARESCDEAVAAAQAARDAIVGPIDLELAPIDEKFEARLDEFDEAIFAEIGGETHPWVNDEPPVSLCALTGLPIHDDDELFTDEDGNRIIATALTLRPGLAA
jgi:hypothetical protein